MTTDTPDPAPTEDLAQLLQRVIAEKGLTRTEIARRAGVSVSIVSAWANRTRGQGRGPSRATLIALAAALGEPERAVFAAASRKTPGPLSADQEERVLGYFRQLTAEQQADQETVLRALAERNRQGS